MNQGELAGLVGSSKRTVQRWEVGQSRPAAWEIHKLVDALRSQDPDLAEEIEAWSPRRAPSPLPAPVAAPPPTPPPVLVDALVCAAAEAMAVTPQAIRPALVAAFTRARELRLAPDAVLAVLAPAKPREARSKRRKEKR